MELTQYGNDFRAWARGGVFEDDTLGLRDRRPYAVLTIGCRPGFLLLKQYEVHQKQWSIGLYERSILPIDLDGIA